jgi:NADPH2:quinone reductase
VFGAAAGQGALTTGAAQAHALMESGQHTGKIVLDWSKA